MSNTSDDIISKLRNNLKRIIQLYEVQKDKTRNLEVQNEDLKKRIAELEHKQIDLVTTNDTANLAKAFAAASGSNHDAKIKVNRIVREIDKCIALLNK